MPIGRQQAFHTRHRTDQHQQRGFRQVEIGDQAVDHPELVARIDENPAVAGDRACSAPPAAAVSRLRTAVVPTAITRPPRPRVRRTASQTAAETSRYSACIWCSSMSSQRTGWNVPAPTCSVTSARSTPRRSMASSSRLFKMQARRRRRDGAGLTGIHGLVALAVCGAVFALDIGRQRHMPQLFQRFTEPAARGAQLKETPCAQSPRAGTVFQQDPAACTRAC